MPDPAPRSESRGVTPPVERFSSARIPTRFGDFVAHAYRTSSDDIEQVAYVAGDPTRGAPLVRLHSECLTGDIFGSLRCDCGSQLDAAIERVAAEGTGVIVYLRGHEGRGIGLGQKLRAYALQDEGLDTVDANVALGFPADGRDYAIGAAILKDLGVQSVRLLSNNPDKEQSLEQFGIEVTERIPLFGVTTEENVRYLETKRERMGHHLAATAPPTPDPASVAT